MTIRYLADEDLDAAIIRGLRASEPAVDILDVKTDARLRGLKDAALLQIAAEQGRIVITHDRNTMTAHFMERVAAGKPAPGLFVISDRPEAIGGAIEWLLLAWLASRAEEWRDRIEFMPPAYGKSYLYACPTATSSAGSGRRPRMRSCRIRFAASIT